MLFGRKKEEKIKQDIQEVEEIKLPTLEEIKLPEKTSEKVESAPQLIEEKLTESSETVFPEQERKAKIEEIRKIAPVFIKLEKYEDVLNTINELKSVLNLLKNTFSILEENEKMRTETTEIIRENVKRIEEKISSLDSILLRPAGYEETSWKEIKAEEVKDTLSTLKSQIDKLKRELKTLE